MKNFYWVTLKDKSGTIEAKDEQEAREIAGPTLQKIQTLPYPAAPNLNHTNMPNFCFQPESCAGLMSCPRNISCSE